MPGFTFSHDDGFKFAFQDSADFTESWAKTAGIAVQSITAGSKKANTGNSSQPKAKPKPKSKPSPKNQPLFRRAWISDSRWKQVFSRHCTHITRPGAGTGVLKDINLSELKKKAGHGYFK